jgi:uncharacterized membrane protein YphA (DoxX/SURF4 family)
MGAFFCISGGTKLFDSAARKTMTQTMVDSGVPFPEFNAVLVPLVEFAFGAGLVLGMLTSLAALVLIGDMVVAVLTNSVGPSLRRKLGRNHA